MICRRTRCGHFVYMYVHVSIFYFSLYLAYERSIHIYANAHEKSIHVDSETCKTKSKVVKFHRCILLKNCSCFIQFSNARKTWTFEWDHLRYSLRLLTRHIFLLHILSSNDSNRPSLSLRASKTNGSDTVWNTLWFHLIVYNA